MLRVMKRVLAVVLLLLVACSSQAPNPQTAPLKVGNYDPETGPEPVGVIPTTLLHDTARAKDLDIAIGYPSRGGPFPVIVFSHGYGVTPQLYEPLVSYWTANGYVVIRPAHADAGALREMMRDAVREAFDQPAPGDRNRRQQPAPQAPPAERQKFRPNPMETIWEKQREPEWRDRVADVRLVIDSLTELENRFPELKGKMDHARIGVAGHSYGAFTTMLISGARTFSNPQLQPVDPRVRAAVAMSPQGPSTVRGLTDQSWSQVKIPIMYMTGTDDQGALEGEDAAWRKKAYELSPVGDKYFVLFRGGRHASFTGQSTGAFALTRPAQNDPAVGSGNQTRGTTAPSREFYTGRNIFQKIKITSLVFWDAYLKDQTAARDLLHPEKLSSVAPGVELERK